jgi:hypothetical protein
MPTVAIIDAVKIKFYYDEHPPPHFHAQYAEYEAMIDLDSLEIVAGALPRPQYRSVVAWSRTRKGELLRAWTRCRSDLTPGRIA